MPSSISLLVYLPDLGGHLKAGEQLGIARFPAHCRLIHAMIPVSSVETCPHFHEASPDLFLSLEAIFLCRYVIIKRRDALISDASADLFDIYDGNAVGHRYRRLCGHIPGGGQSS